MFAGNGRNIRAIPSCARRGLCYNGRGHFCKGVDAMRPLGLYLHIPFCKAKCIYCDFYSLPHSEEKMDAYTAALQRDLIRWADQAKGHTVDTIYFGGGTPSYLRRRAALPHFRDGLCPLPTWTKTLRSRTEAKSRQRAGGISTAAAQRSGLQPHFTRDAVGERRRAAPDRARPHA